MITDQLVAIIQRLTAERTIAVQACAWSEIDAIDRRVRMLRIALLQERAKEIDPRLVSAYRRQKRRCVGCGGKVCKVVLCDECRKTLAYCPDCGCVYPRRTSLPARCSSESCRSCVTRQSQSRRGGGSREAYFSRRQERRAQLLPTIVELRRAHKTFEEIGAALSLTDVQVAVLIRDARKRGEWPDELRRKDGR